MSMKTWTGITTALGLVLPQLTLAASLYGGVEAGLQVQNSKYDDAVEANSSTTIDLGLPIVEINANAEDTHIEDERVMRTEVREGEVSLSYYHDGKLFGIFPVRVDSETSATINGSGETEIRTVMPWWNFFVVGTGNVAEEVHERLSVTGSVQADMKMKGDEAAQARVLEALARAHATIE